MEGLEAIGWCALGAMVPGSIIIGMGLAAWEYENGGPPKWVERLADWLVKISDKYF